MELKGQDLHNFFPRFDFAFFISFLARCSQVKGQCEEVYAQRDLRAINTAWTNHIAIPKLELNF